MFTRLTSRRSQRAGGGKMSGTARGAVFGTVITAVVLGSATAFAGTGIGGVFNLGKTNTVNAPTTLVGKTSGRMLNVQNKGTGAGIGITVPVGKVPIAVSDGAGKAVNLDADKLDGLDSTAFLPAGAKAADAELLDGRDASDFAAAGHNHDGAYLPAGGKATDADRLDGWDSSAFLRTGAKASDADRLDGIDSSAFVRGPGEIIRGARAIPRVNDGWLRVLTTTDPSISVAYFCPADLSRNGVFVLLNEGNEAVNAFADNGGENPLYQQLPPNGGRWDIQAAPNGEQVTLQVQGTQMATYELFSVHRPAMDNCHIQAMATVSR